MMLKFRQPLITSAEVEGLSQPSHLNRKCSFIASQLGHSKASIIIRNLSLPLAWPIDEYFGETKEWREFDVQLELRSVRNSTIQFSKLKRINRTFTDVEFEEDFIFPNEDTTFCIELFVLCKRMTESLGSMMHVVTQSVGRSIGHSWRKYQQREKYQNRDSATRFAPGINCTNGAPDRGFLEELRKFGIREELKIRTKKSGEENQSFTTSLTTHFSKESQDQIVGIARFRLANASLSGRTHSYVLEKVSTIQYHLPIYGNISAQILVQPNSVVSPLAEGSLDIFLPNEGILHQKLHCILQGGLLCCWKIDNNEIFDYQRVCNASNSTFCLQFTGKEHLEQTSFPTTFRINYCNENNIFDSSKSHTNKSLLCICPTKHSLIAWRNAINLQLHDNNVWGEFSHIQQDHHSLTIQDPPQNETIKRPSRYVLSLQVNGSIGSTKNICFDEKIKSIEKTVASEDINSKSINNTGSETQRPFNINFVNTEMGNIKRERRKCIQIERSETWHFSSKCRNFTRL